MHINPIQTRVLEPPQDDFYTALQESNLVLQDRDILVVSSKVLAIHEGRTRPVEETDKQELGQAEADVTVDDPSARFRISVAHSTFLSNGGVDESNGHGYYVLLPTDPMQSATDLRDTLRRQHGIDKLGVIVTDSRSTPLRYGSSGVAIGWRGIEPVAYYTGEPDVFGRPAAYTRVNVVDSIAAGAVFTMGDCAEQTPVAVVRQAPHVKFTDRDTGGELFVPPREDIFWPLLRPLYEQDDE